MLNLKNWNGPQASKQRNKQTDTIARIEQVRLKTVGHSWAKKMHSRAVQVLLNMGEELPMAESPFVRRKKCYAIYRAKHGNLLVYGSKSFAIHTLSTISVTVADPEGRGGHAPPPPRPCKNKS